MLFDWKCVHVTRTNTVFLQHDTNSVLFFSDVCLSHETLSDPWRNIGFNLTSFPGGPMNELNMKEGWYHLTGIGGDNIVHYCLSIILKDSSGFRLLSDNGSSAEVALYTCDTVIDSPRRLDCGKGLILYYLFPMNGTYTTQFITALTEECKVHCSAKCGKDLLEQIVDSPGQVLSKNVVAEYLNEEMNCMKAFEGTTIDKQELSSYGNSVLEATRKLMSGLVIKTDTYYSISINLQTVDAEVFVVGPKASLTEIPQLNARNAYLDIDLIGIAKNNNGFAAVAFTSYTNLSNILNPSLIKHGFRGTVFLSTVVSVILMNVTNTQFTKPARITFKHITEVDHEGSTACVTWKGSEWMTESHNTVSNSSHTVVSINYPGTFALIMQFYCSPRVISQDLNLLNMVSVAVGLGFLSLTLLTFALFRHSKMNRMAQVNLSISLLLAHLLFLLTEQFLDDIYATQLACKVVAGVLHFLFLSAFVWMFIDAALLFIFVRNLTKIRTNQREVLGWKCFTMIGYLIPLIIVGISAGIVPDGYGSKQCWLKMNKDFFWSFLGPVCCILGLNLILFVTIFINVTFALRNLNSEILQRKNTLADKKVIQSVMLKTMAQFFILGCPWILGLFTCNNEVLEIIFLLLNSQQGTFMFLTHCVLNKEVSHHFLF
ncbi:hypothetical protein SRHO_G00180160 [Serrasalmus rhombeus]